MECQSIGWSVIEICFCWKSTCFFYFWTFVLNFSLEIKTFNVHEHVYQILSYMQMLYQYNLGKVQNFIESKLTCTWSWWQLFNFAMMELSNPKACFLVFQKWNKGTKDLRSSRRGDTNCKHVLKISIT